MHIYIYYIHRTSFRIILPEINIDLQCKEFAHKARIIHFLSPHSHSFITPLSSFLFFIHHSCLLIPIPISSFPFLSPQSHFLLYLHSYSSFITLAYSVPFLSPQSCSSLHSSFLLSLYILPSYL